MEHTFTDIPTRADGENLDTALDINTLMENDRFSDEKAENNAAATNLRLHTGTDSSSFGYSFRRQKTLNTKYGFWGDVIWSTTTTIIVKPKSISGHSWIGVVLNDGKYLEATSAITVTLDTSTLDGVGAVQASSWYRIFGYEKADGSLGFGLWFMPVATLSAANPTNTLTLTPINSKDIKSLFPVGSNLCLWESTTKFETPIYGTTGGFSASKSNMAVTGHPGTNQITLANSLIVTNFVATTTKVYAVDGFKPADCSTGALNALIGTRGWIDTGIPIYSSASSNITNFKIDEDRFYFSNGTGSADIVSTNGLNYFNPSTAFLKYLIISCPHDKSLLWGSNSSPGYNIYMKNYYETYGRICAGINASDALESSQKISFHKIINVKYSGTLPGIWAIGYYI